MIVPNFWAEARRQHRADGKQVTVRRYGWSDRDAADAQAMAESRADEALKRILNGEELDRRELKVAYNGADGLPIREEVLERHGEEVVTRNAYGARCLNTPRLLIADIDFDTPLSCVPILISFFTLVAGAVIAGFWFRRWGFALGLGVFALLLCGPLAMATHRVWAALWGGPARLARRRLERFVDRHPAWNVRLYETPAGYRVLATHQAFDSQSFDALEFFSAIRADPLYVRMCVRQRCFRARLTAKPWRIGVGEHLRPRPGVWPVRPERRRERDAWIERYEAEARRYSACRYVESLGSGRIDESLRAVVEYHDRESRATVTTAGLA